MCVSKFSTFADRFLTWKSAGLSNKFINTYWNLKIAESLANANILFFVHRITLAIAYDFSFYVLIIWKLSSYPD